ncbi:MAG: electron transfer flavoprotein-ubiquinone oxidoreductase [Legionellaceae bacterium]|nr:electron transfer flavoprotein-ubiquinone oxidoreductase [Legionellaceae bacterium]
MKQDEDNADNAANAMTYDVIIIGAGPAGLAAAIRIKQQAKLNQQDISVCILEKGAQVGSHLLSGAVLDPKSLKTLLPDTWQDAPLHTPVTHDKFYYLNTKRAYRLPTPPQMRNTGHYIISVCELGRFLATQAEALGCELYAGFAATELLVGEQGEITGVATGPVGLDKSGEKTSNYQPGMYLYAKQTLFAEGCRGELSQQLMAKFNLRDGVQPQTYGLGIKEIWRVTPEQHRLGEVVHTVGWPLDNPTYGGSFIYHMKDHQVALGFVVGLDYQNPWLSPFEEMQRFKTHPSICNLLKGGERLSYGARALNEGGWQSMPKLIFPGGALIGDAAGFLNVPKIKGIHTAIQSGIFAADACTQLLKKNASNQLELTSYPEQFKQSWLAKELYAARNIRPGFKYGLFAGLANAAFETYITRGHTPWTLKHHTDHTSLMNANKAPKINYPKPDGQLTFDRLSSVYLTNTHHEENQPAHLKLKKPELAITINYAEYASPETRYCPAAVYEIIQENNKPRLKINAANCIHCKTCDIKDPKQNIVWTAPEGGGGPNYIGM